MKPHPMHPPAGRLLRRRSPLWPPGCGPPRRPRAWRRGSTRPPPADRGSILWPPERALARGQVFGSAREELEAVGEAGEEHLRGQQLYSCRCEFYGERETVEAGTNLSYRRRVLTGDLEAGLRRPRALYEQPHRLVLGENLNGRQPFRVRDGERRHGVVVLTVEAERDAAGGEHLQARSG